MTLTTEPKGIGSHAVEEICKLEDPVYRNCWITYGYYDLSQRLRDHIGDNASWCTFARWSSATVGESLRLDLDSSRLRDVFHRWPGWISRIAQDVYRDARAISDSAMPRTLAQGNHFVFHEIGHAVAEFLEWFEPRAKKLWAATDGARMREWKKHRANIEEFRKADEIFRRGDVEWLRDGIECYFMATSPDIDDSARSQLVLRGNILLASYEQWRLDPILRIALDPFANHLVEFHATDIHEPPAPGEYPRPVLRRRGTRWALKHESAMFRWLAEKYAGVLTRHWMTLNIPIDDAQKLTPIVLGQGVPEGAANRAFRRQRRLDDQDLTKWVAIYDHNHGHHTSGARNWGNYAERMQFIVELFLALQNNKNLYTELPEEELALLRLDLGERNLDRARTICDKPMDDYVEAHCAPDARDARALVHELVRHGLKPELDQALPDELRGALPAWAKDTKKLEAGQRFFRDNCLEIATALFSASLPLTYTAERGAHVLTATAELASGNVNRRVAETGKMLLDIMTLDHDRAPLNPGTPGWQAARGVRLFHAAVRHMLWDRTHQDRDEYHPISQEDLLGALVAFTVVVLDSLDKMGVPAGPAEKEAYVYLWVVAGHLLGIDYALVHREEGERGRRADPLTLPELRLLGSALWRRNARASADGQTLTAALMHMFRDTTPRLFRGVPPAATRFLIGDESGDILEVPNAGAPARLMLHVGRPITRLAGRVLRTGLLSGQVHSNTAKLYEKWISTNQGDRPPWRVDDKQLKKKLRLHSTESPQNGRRAADRRQPVG